MALAALTLHKRTPGWGFQDPGSYTFGGHTFRNDVRSGQGWVDMNRAIVVSNDTYFYMLAHDLGVNNDRQLHEAVGLRPDHRHRHFGRGARHPAVHGMEAQGVPQARTAALV